MPAGEELLPRDHPACSEYGRVLKIHVATVKPNHDHVVPILPDIIPREVYFAGILPSLACDDHRDFTSLRLLQIGKREVCPQFSLQAMSPRNPNNGLRGCTGCFGGVQFLHEHALPLIDSPVIEDGLQGCSPAGI